MAVLAAAALLGACATVPPASQTTELTPVEVGSARPVAPEAQLQFHILAGEMAAGRRMPAEAAQHFLDALAIQPNADLAARATALALAAEDLELSAQAAEHWLVAEPTNMNAREVLLRLHLRAGHLTETMQHAEKLIADHPGGRGEGYRAASLLMAQEPDKSELALAIMQQLVAQDPQLPPAYYALGLLAMRHGELGLAERAAREAIRLQPGSKEAALLLAGIQLKQGELDAADQTLEDVIRASRDGHELRLGYAKLLLDSCQRERGREQLLRGLAAEPGNPDVLFALALLALEDEKLDEAERHLKKLVATGERKQDAAYYLGRIEQIRGNYQEALKWFEQVAAGPQALDASIHRAVTLSQLGRIQDARTMLEQLRRLYPQYAERFYGAEGEILYNAGHYADAIKVYDRALEQMPEERDLLYGRSLAYERAQRLDLAEADLRALIAIDADDSRALNALGYLLTVHTQRYDEALALIERAHALDPEDAAVIDSLGWINYRLGKLQEARGLLQRAFDKFPDAEIAAHLGEVLWQLGERDRAKEIWDAALKEDPKHQLLRETVERFK